MDCLVEPTEALPKVAKQVAALPATVGVAEWYNFVV